MKLSSDFACEPLGADLQAHRLANSKSLHVPGIPIEVEGAVQESSGKIPGLARSVPEEHLTRECWLVECSSATDFAERESWRKRLGKVDTGSRFDHYSSGVAADSRRE